MQEYKLIHDEDLDGEFYYYLEVRRELQVSPFFTTPDAATAWYDQNIRQAPYSGGERRSDETAKYCHGRRAGDVDVDFRCPK